MKREGEKNDQDLVIVNKIAKFYYSVLLCVGWTAN